VWKSNPSNRTASGAFLFYGPAPGGKIALRIIGTLSLRKGTVMRITLTLLGTLALVAAASGQPNANFTRARPPDRGELDRAQLKLAWTIGLPVESNRDGIATVQLIPVPDPLRKGAETTLLVVQMRSGTIAVYQADSGRKLWSKQPPPAYPVSVPEVSYDPRGA